MVLRRRLRRRRARAHRHLLHRQRLLARLRGARAARRAGARRGAPRRQPGALRARQEARVGHERARRLRARRRRRGRAAHRRQRHRAGAVGPAAARHDRRGQRAVSRVAGEDRRARRGHHRHRAAGPAARSRRAARPTAACAICGTCSCGARACACASRAPTSASTASATTTSTPATGGSSAPSAPGRGRASTHRPRPRRRARRSCTPRTSAPAPRARGSSTRATTSPPSARPAALLPEGERGRAPWGLYVPRWFAVDDDGRTLRCTPTRILEAAPFYARYAARLTETPRTQRRDRQHRCRRIPGPRPLLDPEASNFCYDSRCAAYDLIFRCGYLGAPGPCLHGRRARCRRASCSSVPARRRGACASWPHIALVRPCEGLDPSLAETLRSSATARYEGRRTIFFCVPSALDPAYAVIERVRDELVAAGADVRLVVTAIETPANRKAAQLAVVDAHLPPGDEAGILVVADSDVQLDDESLPSLVSALALRSRRGRGLGAADRRQRGDGGRPLVGGAPVVDAARAAGAGGAVASARAACRFSPARCSPSSARRSPPSVASARSSRTSAKTSSSRAACTTPACRWRRRRRRRASPTRGAACAASCVATRAGRWWCGGSGRRCSAPTCCSLGCTPLVGAGALLAAAARVDGWPLALGATAALVAGAHAAGADAAPLLRRRRRLGRARSPPCSPASCSSAPAPRKPAPPPRSNGAAAASTSASAAPCQPLAPDGRNAPSASR